MKPQVPSAAVARENRLTAAQSRDCTLGRVLEACVTGKECRINAGPGYGRPPAISVGGLGQLSRFDLWSDAMRQVIDLPAVHPNAKLRWLEVWSRISFRSWIQDEDLFYRALRAVLPAYNGDGVTVYRGQAAGASLEPSWARQPHIALKFAMAGVANVDPVKLAIKGLPPNIAGRNDAQFVTAFAPAEAIICDAYRYGHPEGEYIVDPRKLVEIKRQSASEAAPWVRYHTARLLERARLWT